MLPDLVVHAYLILPTGLLHQVSRMMFRHVRVFQRNTSDYRQSCRTRGANILRILSCQDFHATGLRDNSAYVKEHPVSLLLSIVEKGSAHNDCGNPKGEQKHTQNDRQIASNLVSVGKYQPFLDQ